MPKPKEVPVMMTASDMDAIYWDMLPLLKQTKPRIAKRIQDAILSGRDKLSPATPKPERLEEIARRRKFYGKGKRFHA